MTRRRGRRSSRPWYVFLLGAIAIAIVVLGIAELGTPTSSARVSKETVTAEDGVVQTTVSGTGNVEPTVDQDVNFDTSGTLQSVNVTVGEHVKKGQLIATLNPSSAQLTLQEAQDSLTAAQDNLTSVEDGDSSSGSSGSGSSGSGSSGDASAADVSSTEASAASVDAHYGGTTTYTTTTPATTTGTGTTTTPTETGTTPTTTTPVGTTPTTTTTAPTKTTTTGTKTTTTGTKTTPTGTGTTPTGTKTTPSKTETTPTNTTSTKTDTNSNNSGAGATRTVTVTTPTQTTAKSTPSPSSIAQAEAQVDSAEATVTSDEKAVDETKLYAPVSGTIAALSDTTIGNTISSGGSSADSADSGASGEGAAAEGSSSDSSSSTGFATIINSKTMTMTVSLSEDDISSVKVGQLATVSMTALSSVQLAGSVTSISPLGSSSDGVVSYDVTVTTTQGNSKVLPGMSATATIVAGQAQGVTLSNEAITGSGSDATVNLDTNGKITSQAVTVGLKGTSRSVITSGLKAGQEVQITVALPALGTSTTSTTSGTTGLGGFGGAGGAGGAAGGRGGAFRALFSGGGAG